MFLMFSVSNDQGVHMSITLNSKIMALVMLAKNNVCGRSMLCNQIQGEHTLILRTYIKILSYFNNYWGYLKPF
jgi:predicted metalloenzyme YecM